MRFAMVLLAAALPLALPAPAPSQIGAPTMTQHATGTFEVRITPEAQTPAADGGVPTGRFALHKTFSGGLEGVAIGTMLSAGEPKPGAAATYVAIDQFTGKLAGRAGGFVLAHRGTMTKTGAADLTVIVAPDSATGDLAGLTGTLTIEIKDGKHFYDLTYTLPAR